MIYVYIHGHTGTGKHDSSTPRYLFTTVIIIVGYPSKPYGRIILYTATDFAPGYYRAIFSRRQTSVHESPRQTYITYNNNRVISFWRTRFFFFAFVPFRGTHGAAVAVLHGPRQSMCAASVRVESESFTVQQLVSRLLNTLRVFATRAPVIRMTSTCKYPSLFQRLITSTDY